MYSQSLAPKACEISVSQAVAHPIMKKKAILKYVLPRAAAANASGERCPKNIFIQQTDRIQ